jgi:hypothetical protein
MFSKNVYSIFFVFLNFVHHDIWIWTYCLNAYPAFRNFTKSNFCTTASLNFNSMSINICDITTENLRLCCYTLQVNSNETTIGYCSILNYYSIILFWHKMHCALIEIWKFTIRYLDICANSNDTSTMICFISYNLTSNQIYRRFRKSYNSCKFLI